jgi:multidrug efflux system outer membrane protein
VLLAALSLAGCVVGPHYKRPEVNPARDFRSQVGPAEAQSIADLPWWQVFNDRALHRLITQALNGNYDLQAAISRVDQAREKVGIAQADLYPQIGYEGIAARQKTFVPFEVLNRNITYNAFGVAATAAWELDIWGRVRHTTEAARANLFAQEDVRRGIMLTLVGDVAAGYFMLLELDRQLAIAKESATAYQQTLDLFTQRFQAGRDSKLGVVRAQANLDSSNDSIARLSRAIVQQENALCVLLGTYPRAIDRGSPLTDQVMPSDSTRFDDRHHQAPPRHPAGGAGNDWRQRRDWRRGGQLLSQAWPVRALWRPSTACREHVR